MWDSRNFVVTAAILSIVGLTFCSQVDHTPTEAQSLDGVSLLTYELAADELQAIWSDALDAGLAAWVDSDLQEHDLVQVEGVRAADSSVMAVRATLPSGDSIGWTYAGAAAPVIVLMLREDASSSPTERTFVNVRTGVVRHFDLESLKAVDEDGQYGVHDFVDAGVDSLGACGSALVAGRFGPSALDPVCYDDSMRGSQATCAADCTLALLVGGPAGYIACFGACMSIWHATCRIGCDF